MKTEDLKTMSTDIATATQTEADNILGAVRQEQNFEKILKFKKGFYKVGNDDVPLGATFLAHTIGWTKAWLKFIDSKLVERKMYRAAKGQVPPEREELGDLDQTKWPTIDGKKADPWN